MARMKKRGAEPKKTSLFSTMTRLSKRGHIFYKEDQPSTFGLLEWKNVVIQPNTGSLKLERG